MCPKLCLLYDILNTISWTSEIFSTFKNVSENFIYLIIFITPFLNSFKIHLTFLPTQFLSSFFCFKHMESNLCEQIPLGEEPTPEALWTFPVAPVTSSSSARAGTSSQSPPPCWVLSALSFPVSCGCCHKRCEFKCAPALLCLWQFLSLVGRAVI